MANFVLNPVIQTVSECLVSWKRVIYPSGVPNKTSAKLGNENRDTDNC